MALIVAIWKVLSLLVLVLSAVAAFIDVVNKTNADR